MKRTFCLAFLLLGAATARGQDDMNEMDPTLPAVAEPSCFGDRVRVSALISTGERVKVGLVETATKASYLVSPGEFAGEVEVVAADYEHETVVLRLNGETCTLNLSSDPNAIQYAQNLLPPPENVYRGEAIEAFLRENPNAIQEGMIKFPLPIMPEAVGRGEGIERFLRENPDMAAKANRPVVGKGEGIEGFLKQHPEIKIDDSIPEGSFGPGIEAELKKHPELMTNSSAGIPVELRGGGQGLKEPPTGSVPE